MTQSTENPITDPLLRKRLSVPDAAEDNSEHLWWNSNADLVERIWASDSEVRAALRTDYLGMARRFLTENNGRDTFLFEIGSGSGWVGRALVQDTRSRVLGIDLSEAQVEIAKENAKAQGLDAQCGYICANLSEVAAHVPVSQEISGVVIHAILHHLTWTEVDKVLAEVVRQGPGAKLFVYEPVFFPNGVPPGFRRGTWLSRKLAVLSSVGVLFSMRVFGRITAVGRDAAVLRRLDSVVKEAEKNHWVLSPKEVVFDHQELIDKLETSFRVKRAYLCNYIDMNAANMASVLKGPGISRWVYTKLYMPVLRRLDRWLVTSGAIFELCRGGPRSHLVDQHFPRYCFWGAECLPKR